MILDQETAQKSCAVFFIAHRQSHTNLLESLDDRRSIQVNISYERTINY